LEKNLGNSAFGYFELWKFGDYKHFTSKVNVQVLGIRQKDIDSQVGHVFMSIRILIELLLIVKGHHCRCSNFSSTAREKILIEDEITHV
jgi:hypothetical protein